MFRRKALTACFSLPLLMTLANCSSEAPQQVQESTPVSSSTKNATEKEAPTSSSAPTTSTSTDRSATPTTAGAPPVEQPVPDSQTPSTPEPAGKIYTTPGGGYRCPQTDAWVTDPSYCLIDHKLVDPNENCPAYLCGYGVDENGNHRPSNSEIQNWWGDCIAVNTTEYCRENDLYQK